MNCGEVLHLAPLYLTGELEPGSAGEIAAHIKGCPSCAYELGHQRVFDALLRETVLAEDADISSIERNVRQLVENGGAGPVRGWARGWMFAIAGLAAVILLAVILMRARPVYAAAAQDHRLEIVESPAQKMAHRPCVHRRAGTTPGRRGFSCRGFGCRGLGYRCDRSRRIPSRKR